MLNKREMDAFSEAVSNDLLFLRGRSGRSGRRLVIDGQEHLDFSTASYLGFDTDDDIVAAVSASLQGMGLGRCSSPLYFASEYYGVIEDAIRRITGCERCLLFSSTSLANLAAICYGVPPGYAIIADEYCHRSITEAIRHRHGQATRYRHCDLASLKHAVEGNSDSRPAAIVTDGVFSMSGVVAPMKALDDVARNRGALLVVDDAHGFATDGDNGEGVLQEVLRPVSERVIYVASLTKAISGFGGFIACSEEVAERIVRSRPQFGFSCSIPQAYAVAAAYALTAVGTAKWRAAVAQLKANWYALAEALANTGRRLIASYSPIAVLETATQQEARRLALSLQKARIAFNAVGFPAVPKGHFRLRFCLSASHSRDDIECLVASLTVR